MVSYIIGFVGVLVSLIGWFGFQSLPALIVGTVLYLIETFLELKSLNKGAKIVDVVIFVIGAVCSLFAKTPFYIGGMIAINIYSAIICLLGLPVVVSEYRAAIHLAKKEKVDNIFLAFQSEDESEKD